MRFIFVVVNLFILFAVNFAAAAAIEPIPPTPVEYYNMEDIVCLPLEDDNGVFECATSSNGWAFCVMDDDLELFCIH